MRHELQERLNHEPSTIEKALQGEELTQEQRWLARDSEINVEIKKLQDEQKGIRDALKEWYKENVVDVETGEVQENAPTLSVGTIQYAPTTRTNWTYDVEAFLQKLGTRATPFIDVSSGRVTAALKAKVLKESDLEGTRTAEVTVTHGTKTVKE